MQRSAFFSYRFHCARILAHGLSFDSVVVLIKQRNEERDEGERENVICNLDYVNVDT